jgi:hypothetical protein
MANLVYLIAAVAISAVFCLGLWLRNRKPRSTEAGIDSFQRGLRALAPDSTASTSGPAGDGERPPPG